MEIKKLTLREQINYWTERAVKAEERIAELEKSLKNVRENYRACFLTCREFEKEKKELEARIRANMNIHHQKLKKLASGKPYEYCDLHDTSIEKCGCAGSLEVEEGWI